MDAKRKFACSIWGTFSRVNPVSNCTTKSRAGFAVRPIQPALAWVGIWWVDDSRIIIGMPTSVYPPLRFATCGVASHPRAQNALEPALSEAEEIGHAQLGWRTHKGGPLILKKVTKSTPAQYYLSKDTSR